MSLLNESHCISADLEEELANVPLMIEGKIPNWLSGTLIRNGPISVTIDGQTNAHWFDGLAMLHAFSFHQGNTSYTNKFLRTHAYNQVFKKGSLNYAGFAQDPCRSLFKNLFTWFLPNTSPILYNANINVAKFADQYVALTETPLPVRFDLNTLDTLGVFDYQDQLLHDKCWESAHPHYDHNSCQTMNYLIEYGRQSYYTLYFLKDGSSQREVIGKIPVQNPSYMHSFAVTENYVIFTQFPFVVKPLDLLIKGRAFIKNFSWEPERGTKITVVDRKNGNVLEEYKTKAFFAFHHANAFEKNGNIYLDIVVYEDAKMVTDLANHFRRKESEPKNIENLIPSRLERYSLKGGEVSSQTLFNSPVEFPRINGNYDGKSYTYLYLIDPREPISKNDVRPIYKVNTESQETLQWSEKGYYPGEPVFVARPNASEEDDGVVLTVILDKLRQSSFLLILDAQTFQEMGRAKVSHVIPQGLHGQYFSESIFD